MSGQAYIADSCWLMCESPQPFRPWFSQCRTAWRGDNTPADISSTNTNPSHTHMY